MLKPSFRASGYATLCGLLLSSPLTSAAAFVINATAGNQQVTVQWSAVKNASNYGVCYATEAIVDINNCEKYAGGTWSDTPKTSLKITGLSNGLRYYFRVLAENPTAILAVSNPVSAAPKKIASVKTTLNDTGITNQQCYQLDSDSLTSCTSAAAKALNPVQDGMIGRDVTASNNSDGHLGFNFTKLSSTGAALPATAKSWACVKDNVTGLIWENKTNDGSLHDRDNTYTHYSANYGAENLGSASDASGFVAAVNQQGWCGSKAWRLPTVAELLGIVDYSVAYPGLRIDTTFFPNTLSNAFWSSSPSGKPDIAWYVNSDYGDFYGHNRDEAFAVRLVRANQ